MSIEHPGLPKTNVNPAELPDHVERVDEAFDNTSLPQAHAEGLVDDQVPHHAQDVIEMASPDTANFIERPVTAETDKKKRRGLIVGAAAVVATGLAGIITATSIFTGIKPSGEADNKNLPPTPDPKLTSQGPTTESKAPTAEQNQAPKTWQEELAAGIESRPKTGPQIKVGNRPVTAADAKAWLDADNTCIMSGAIKFSSQSNSNKFIFSLLANGEQGRQSAMRQSLKTDENWATCAGGLYSSPEAGAFSTGRDLNFSIINNEMSGRTVTNNPTEEPQITIIDDTTVKALVHRRLVTIQADGKVLDDSMGLDGGTLKVQNGNLVWVGPY